MSRDRRNGSAMSSKQLARTVVDGRVLVITTNTGDVVTGYLAGMDDYNLLVITPMASTVLLHKSAPKIVIGEKTYADEPQQDAMEIIIRPFRNHLRESGLVPQRPLSVVSATEGSPA